MTVSPGTRPISVPKTILFVDDEPCLLEVRSLIFESLGYRVLAADSGERALELLQVNTVHAVILDYVLPGMDGEETARRIRRAHANIVIILSSGGFIEPECASEFVNASVDKGTGPEVLREVLEQQLRVMPGATTRCSLHKMDKPLNLRR